MDLFNFNKVHSVKPLKSHIYEPNISLIFNYAKTPNVAKSRLISNVIDPLTTCHKFQLIANYKLYTY